MWSVRQLVMAGAGLERQAFLEPGWFAHADRPVIISRRCRSVPLAQHGCADRASQVERRHAYHRQCVQEGTTCPGTASPSPAFAQRIPNACYRAARLDSMRSDGL